MWKKYLFGMRAQDTPHPKIKEQAMNPSWDYPTADDIASVQKALPPLSLWGNSAPLQAPAQPVFPLGLLIIRIP